MEIFLEILVPIVSSDWLHLREQEPKQILDTCFFPFPWLSPKLVDCTRKVQNPLMPSMLSYPVIFQYFVADAPPGCVWRYHYLYYFTLKVSAPNRKGMLCRARCQLTVDPWCTLRIAPVGWGATVDGWFRWWYLWQRVLKNARAITAMTAKNMGLRRCCCSNCFGGPLRWEAFIDLFKLVWWSPANAMAVYGCRTTQFVVEKYIQKDITKPGKLKMRKIRNYTVRCLQKSRQS